jgi:glycine/D-amino acid oxidase-like deaminating enzyme
MHVCIVGAGVFGAAAALELARRGRRVTLFDSGEIPHPLAASTDVSKAVRMDYGADELYAAEMERALDAWRAWNQRFDETLFHETGAMFVTRDPMAPGGFEHDSFVTLGRRGHRLERLDAAAIAARSSLRGFVDGYFNPEGGWAASGRVVERLTSAARDAGAVVTSSKVSRAGPDGVELATGDRLAADAVVVAGGSWTPSLLPELAACFRTVGQPVFHLVAPESVRLPVFGADIARTGWYGFPRDPRGFVKVANHGAGRAMHPESPARAVTAEEEASLRDFLRVHLPALETAPLVATRTCVYCDTLDEHFWIAPHPEVPTLVVATGGSGHGFKFAPLLGAWIARALEGDVIPRFRWRAELRAAAGEEASRHHG